MEQMINLKDLLVHEVQDLYSAEEQIIEALPSMIEKANNSQLKKALQDHLKVTEKQKDRLDKVKQLLGVEEQGEKKGLFSKLFGGGSHKCKGTEGLIKEGQKIMAENMTTEVRDAAIIASAQKIEHYEICGYGTARAFARELNLGEVAELLEETLNEEYESDDLLTDLAVGKLNEEAEKARRNGRDNKGASKSAVSKGTASKKASSKNTPSKSASSKKALPKAASKPTAVKAAKSTAGSRGVGKNKSASVSRSKSSAVRSHGSRVKSR
jgi:ferritin-like metal-binding protein YciE